jgi:hydrogenase expression/formation protein HypC
MHTRRAKNRNAFKRESNGIKMIKMCLAIPAKVVELKENTARVDFGEGVLRDVNATLVEAKVGEYVLVHAGYAIQVLDKRAAEETLHLWKEVLASSENLSA